MIHKISRCNVWAFFLLILLTLSISSHIFAEPLKPENYDILGIRIGMSKDEVAAAAESQGFELSLEQTISIDGDDNSYLDYQRWTEAEGSGGVYAFYTRPPAQPRVMVVSRPPPSPQVVYRNQQLQDALVQKYGEPTESDESYGFLGYGWYHGGPEDGERCALMPPPDRNTGTGIHTNASIVPHFFSDNNCSGVHLRIMMRPGRNAEGAIYSLNASVLVDVGAMVESVNMFNEYLEEVARQREESLLDYGETPVL